MRPEVMASVALMYVILVGANLPAPLLGLRFESSDPKARLWYEPPGYVIPAAWFGLFALLGIAHYLMRVSSRAPLQWYIVALAVLCATYAYYTLGLARLTGISALWFGLWGNIAVIACTLLVAHRVHGASPAAAGLVLPVAAWTLFATTIVVGQMRSQGLLGQ